MIYKDSQSTKSLLDFLVHIMPDWKEQVLEYRSSPRYLQNGRAAKALFHMWRDENNKVGEYVLKRPTHVSLEDIRAMQQQGLVRDLGEKVEITSKGKEVIKTMILGDEKSVYEDDGSILSYEAACDNIKRRTKTARKTAGVPRYVDKPEVRQAADVFHYALRIQLGQYKWHDVPEELHDAVRAQLKRCADSDNWYKKMKNNADNDHGQSN